MRESLPFRPFELKYSQRPVLVNEQDVEPTESDPADAPVDLQIFVTQAYRKP
jgi:hypothetical protein